MPRKPSVPRHKFVVTLSVESPQRATKARVKHLVQFAVEEAMLQGTGESAKVRVRTVDFD